MMFMSLSIQALGQSGRLSGTVTDAHGRALAGASVSIGGGIAPQITDPSGRFSFVGLQQPRYTLTVTHLGYNPYTGSVTLESQPTLIEIRLTPDARVLDDVTVTGKTETQQVREQAIRAVVVDTRAVAEQPATLAELMNRAPGIRIRQSGGLGNAVDVSVNGFQGNSVQYFRDGIPLEYLGGGYGINNVPLNLLERVEVYKGVVPVSIGGDALGGAVNLVSSRQAGTRLDASYEVASFNTHIGNLSFHYADRKNRYFAGLDAFANYSENDYRAEVEVSRNGNLVPTTVRLFHNDYRHAFGEAYFGIRNRPWADELKLAIATYGISRASQHPALMTNPYGAIRLNNKGFVPSVRYKKSFFGQRLSVDQFGSYSMTNRGRIDTIRGTYDWFGEFLPRPGDGVGESPNPSLSDIDFTNLISRTGIAFQINRTHRLEANAVLSYNERVGRDPLGFRFAGTDIDVLSKPASYLKTVAGVMWESKWLDGALTNQASIKYFRFKSTGINAFLANDTDLDKFTTATDDNWGIGEAVRYQLTDRSFLRASAELTNRLPREEELFGNNDTRAPNFNLKPERSFNVNLGYSYATEKLGVEVGTFYRKTKGMILLVPLQPPFAQYQNLDSIRGYGFDIDFNFRPTRAIAFNANATWQDNRMIDVATPLYKWINGTRVRNTPFFFANAGLSGHFNSVITGTDVLKPYINFNFIREFYLNYIPRHLEAPGFLGLFGRSGVQTKDLVPDQILASAGFNYWLPNRNIGLGVEVKNLTDSKLFDYYKVQRPGRSVHFKINYHIKSTKS